MITNGGNKVQKPYAPKRKPFTEEADRLGKTVKAYRNPEVDAAMERWKIRNPTAPDPTEGSVSDAVSTSGRWRKRHAKRGHVTTDSDPSTANPVASAAPGSPVDATRYLSPENRQLMEEATRLNPVSAQRWVNQSNDQSILSTTDSNVRVSTVQYQTSLNAMGHLNDPTELFESAQIPFPEPSVPLFDPLDVGWETSWNPCDPSLEVPDPISNFDQGSLLDPLQINTETPPIVRPIDLYFVSLGPRDFEEEAARNGNRSKPLSRDTNYLTRCEGPPDVSVIRAHYPSGEDEHMRRYQARRELLDRFPATDSGAQTLGRYSSGPRAAHGSQFCPPSSWAEEITVSVNGSQ